MATYRNPDYTFSAATVSYRICYWLCNDPHPDVSSDMLHFLVALSKHCVFILCCWIFGHHNKGNSQYKVLARCIQTLLALSQTICYGPGEP
ncbi:hypothetical protein RB195_006583 [Necator americanus]|uniref:Uncharacterized protein n=1 Tax=Necator americanus TaxID=51031 RepID=A0ABR1BX45_NECAM